MSEQEGQSSPEAWPWDTLVDRRATSTTTKPLWGTGCEASLFQLQQWHKPMGASSWGVGDQTFLSTHVWGGEQRGPKRRRKVSEFLPNSAGIQKRALFGDLNELPLMGLDSCKEGPVHHPLM